jgi:hypothetical protein
LVAKLREKTPLQMVAARLGCRTVTGMTSSLASFAAYHDPQNPDAALAALLAIGADRINQEAAGGPALAAFGDFCWGLSCPLSVDLFELWVTEVAGRDAFNESDVARARTYLEQDS